MYTSPKCFWRAQAVATRKRRASKYVARAMDFDTFCRGGTGSNSARAKNEPHNYAKRMSAPSPRERGGRRREARNRQNAANAPPQNFPSAKTRREARRRRRACRCRTAKVDITAPRYGNSAGNMAAAASRKISGDTFIGPNLKEQLALEGRPGDDRARPWRPANPGA